MIISETMTTTPYDLTLFHDATFDHYFFDLSSFRSNLRMNFVFFDANKNRCIISWELEKTARSKVWRWNSPSFTVNGSYITTKFRAKIPMKIRIFMEEQLQETKHKIMTSLDKNPSVRSIDNVRIVKNKAVGCNFFTNTIHADVLIDGFTKPVQFRFKDSSYGLKYVSCEPELHVMLQHAAHFRKSLVDIVLHSNEVQSVQEIDFSALSPDEIDTYLSMERKEIEKLEELEKKLLKEMALLAETQKKIANKKKLMNNCLM